MPPAGRGCLGKVDIFRPHQLRVFYSPVYLAQHPEYETTATLVARQNGQLTFMIPELAYEYKCRLQGNFTLDTEYKLTLQAADPAAMRTVFKVTKLD